MARCTSCACQRAIDAAIAELTTVEDWHEIGAVGEPAFQNSWANFGGGFADAGFYLDRERVYFTGLIGGGADGSTAFTLPVLYRPLTPVILDAYHTNGAMLTVIVNTNGNVNPTRAVGGAIALVSLDGLSFRVA